MDGSAGTTARVARKLTFLAAGLATLLATCATAAAATPWGELSSVRLPLGTGPGQVDPTARFAAGKEGVTFIAYRTEAFKLLLEEFKGTELLASTPIEVEEPPKGTAEPLAAGVTLATDPVNHRLYVLADVYRKGENENGTFPQDAGVPEAGELYAFEYTGAPHTLTPVKTKENASKETLPGPVLTQAQLQAASGLPRKALLAARAMSVDAKTGDIAIAGDEDLEENSKVQKGEAEKQCRAAVQLLAPTVKAEKLAGVTLARRLVDAGNKLRKGLAEGCGGSEESGEEKVMEQAPAAVAFSPGGRVIVYSLDEGGGSEKGALWEFEKEAGPAESKEVAVEPHELLNLEPFAESDPEPAPTTGEVGAIGVSDMSLARESATTALVYIDGHGPFQAETPLVFQLTEPSGGGVPQASELGWTAGVSIPGNGGTAPCEIPPPDTSAGLSASSVVQLAALEGRRFLAFSAYSETPAGLPPVVQPGVLEFGEGGAVEGCPRTEALAPALEVQGARVSEVPLGTPATLQSGVVRPGGAAQEWPGNVRKVEWRSTYENPATHETREEAPVVVQYPLGVSAEHVADEHFPFAHAGNYTVTAVITTDDLAAEVATSKPVKFLVASRVQVRNLKSEPHEVRSGETEATVSAEVKVPSEPGNMHLTKVKWSFGEPGVAAVELTSAEREALSSTNPGTVTAHHRFHKCGAEAPSTCTVTLVVERKVGEAEAEAAVATTQEIVTASKAEEEARHKAEEQARRKAEEEARRKAEQEAAARKGAEEAAASARHKAEEEAAAAAARKKQEEEARNAVLAYHVAQIASGSSISVTKSGTLSIKVSCPSGQPCAGTLVVKTASAVASGHGRRKAILTLASGGFSVAAGQTVTVTLHLTAKAKTLLAHAHSLRARVSATTHGASETPPTRLATLRLAAGKKKH